MADMSEEEPEQTPKFVTTGKAAEMLGIDRRTVRRWCEADSGLKSWKTPVGILQISVASIESLLEAQEAALS